MTLSKHLDRLAAYNSSAIRIVPIEGEPDHLLGEGGGLEAAFAQLGRAPLVRVLADAQVAEVLLADGPLEIKAHKNGTTGVLHVRYDQQTIVNESVLIPRPTRAAVGPLLRPDAQTQVDHLVQALHNPKVSLFAVGGSNEPARYYTAGTHGPGVGAMPLRGVIPAIDPSQLGAASFREAHGVRWAYVAGAMAGGIASAELVIAMAHHGLLGFFGAGGLPLPAVEEALQRMSAEIGDRGAWGCNLLHNPSEPAVEEATVDLYLKYGVKRVSASAFMRLTPAVVRYRFTGIHRGPDGQAVCPNRVFAKISRTEVAEPFLRPPPDALLATLHQQGVLTEAQVSLARTLPVAEDITAEADSGGHTDHRPLSVLLPTIVRLRDRIAAEQGYVERGIVPRVGAAGGLGTPAALWTAFSLGADYVLTGSINQATTQAGTSQLVKDMLTQASFVDVASGPAPDMFELGAKVQVLSRGSLYARRAQQLYDLYKKYDSMGDIPAKDRNKIETQFFKRTLDEVWADTKTYWQARDPRQVEKAERDGRHQMALTFRWYLGMTSRWARLGEAERKRDFQIWCGPAMGAFNEWVAGSWLAPLQARTVTQVASALMHATCVQARLAQASVLGLALPPGAGLVPVPVGDAGSQTG